MTDILERRGELTSEELQAFQGMTQAELIEEIIQLNRNWYGLFCALELMHSEDMNALEKSCNKQLNLLKNSLQSLDTDTTLLHQMLQDASSELDRLSTKLH